MWGRRRIETHPLLTCILATGIIPLLAACMHAAQMQVQSRPEYRYSASAPSENHLRSHTYCTAYAIGRVLQTLNIRTTVNAINAVCALYLTHVSCGDGASLHHRIPGTWLSLPSLSHEMIQRNISRRQRRISHLLFYASQYEGPLM